MWSFKIIEILSYIKKNPESTLKDIGMDFDISQRNIRYEIEKINEYLLKNRVSEIRIEKGVLRSEDWNEIIKVLEKDTFYAPSSEEREFYVLLEIFLKRKINQREISEDLDISLTTVKGHLKEIKRFLERYNLSLEIEHKKGLELIGKEEDIRSGLLKILNQISKGNSKYLKGKAEELILNTVDEQGLKRFINYCQKLMKIIVSDEAYEIIINYLKVSLSMNRLGYSIESIKNEKFLSETKEYRCIKKASSILEEWYEIELGDVEYLKITDYFLGSNTYNLNYSYYDNWVEMEIIVKEMILEFNRYIEENIEQDKVLMEGLLNHIKPTIYRLKNKIELENSIYNEVIESYPEFYEITKKILKKLEDRMNISFTKDEISFLVIHFKAAVDRNKIRSKKIKVVLVCGAGYGTSKLLSQQLKQYYDLEILEIIPKYLLEKIKTKDEVDLIISTVEIEDSIQDKPVIKLSSILGEEDKKKLERFGIPKNSKKISMRTLLEVIQKNCKEVEEKNLKEDLQKLLEGFLIDDIFHKKNTIFDYIKEDMILLNEKVTSWKEAVEKVGNLLLKSECVKESYIKNSIKTIEEFGSYIVLAPETAFPHARTQGDVIETGFATLSLREPIEFPNKEKVSVLVMFSSKNNEEHLDTFMKLVEMAGEETFLSKVKRMKNPLEFIKMINESS